jgi:nucleoside-diphosphate-sugar epimerase
MVCVVTGATGLVGRSLVADLRRRGHHVTAVVRHEVEAPEADRVVVIGDICDTAWASIVSGATAVFHCAAHVHVTDRDEASDLERFRAVNVAATESLARASVAAGVERFVFVSTIAVYGVSPDHPIREDDPIHPVTAYGISKLEAEKRLQDAAGSMAWTTLRVPLVYGPGVRAKFMQLLRIVDRGLPLPFGRVGNARSMIYVGNLTDAMVRAAGSDNARNEVFLVADDEAWSTPDLVRELASQLGRPARLVPIPSAILAGVVSALRVRQRMDPLLSSFVVDSSRFREQTGWRPPFAARAGLRATVSWYRSR